MSDLAKTPESAGPSPWVEAATASRASLRGCSSGQAKDPSASHLQQSEPAFSPGSKSFVDKEVYEYIPDPALSFAPQNSEADEVTRSSSRAFKGRRNDIDDESLEPSVAFETFRGKTYKTTQFNQGFAKQPSMHARKTRALRDRDFSADFDGCSARKGAPQDNLNHGASMSIFEMGNTCFETPLGRLQRLRMEVEEMLDFVSSFIVRENVEEGKTDTEKAAGGDPSSASKPTYTQKILTSEEKQTLLFGREPLSLMSDLDCLRMQILSVMNDPSLQRLFAGVEPTTGKKSGTQLLLQHLSQVKMNLQAVAGACASKPEDAGEKTAGVSSAEKTESGEPQADAAEKQSVSGAGQSEAAPGTTQYDIYCVPSLKPLLDSGRVATLERRLAQVEGRIGMSNISLLPFSDLQQAVTTISQKLSLLDQNKVEQLQKRTQTLLHELHALQHRRREIDFSSVHAEGKRTEGTDEGLKPPLASRNPQRDDQRVEEMFDLCERWKGTAAALPSVVERLQALKTLHQEAGGLSVRLGVLEEQQGELQSLLAAAEANVESLQHTVMETVSWARSTVEALQWRLQRLGFAEEKSNDVKSETDAQ
uniref:Dynamitin n=1 Tax=Toxoplasma gondii COUG TaxID=1074873 RepID=A0A2G8YBT4_TOXGO|nr:dynamitin [Toxoplasma gondii COUG]